MRTIWELIVYLYNLRAKHVRRGFVINDTPLTFLTNHLIEESVELQSAALHGEPAEQLEEAADVLCLLVHVCYRLGLQPNQVIAFAEEKLDRYFTTDDSKVLTKTPGFTKSTRGPKPEIRI